MLRRKDGVTEFLELAAAQPWRVMVAIASISFVVCFGAAALTRAPPGGPTLMRGFVHDGATVFAFLLPAASLIVAAVAGINRSCSNALLHAAQSNPEVTIPALSQQAFERLIAEGYRRRGFGVEVFDGGGDFALSRGQERFLVRCKQGRYALVDVAEVRELHDVMTSENLEGGYAVTSGSFTEEAKEFAAGRKIELVDGKALSGLIRERRSAMRGARAFMSAGA